MAFLVLGVGACGSSKSPAADHSGRSGSQDGLGSYPTAQPVTTASGSDGGAETTSNVPNSDGGQNSVGSTAGSGTSVIGSSDDDGQPVSGAATTTVPGSEPDTGATPIDPCSLIPTDDARALIGATLGPPKLAPLGPTCIYSASGGTTISVSIQSADLSALKAQMHSVVTSTVAGYAAYCGSLGQDTLVVGLDRPSVLEIIGPCPIAQKLAAVALQHLRSPS